jgi:hypothetical protein
MDIQSVKFAITNAEQFMSKTNFAKYKKTMNRLFLEEQLACINLQLAPYEKYVPAKLGYLVQQSITIKQQLASL